MVRRATCLAAALAVMVLAAGCGYTTHSALPADVKMIHIAPVKNGIDLTGPIDEKHPFHAYRPGLEVDVNNAVINRFVFDGTLKVVAQEKADAVLQCTLVDYTRDPLRYSESDEIQEYRLNVTIAISLVRVSDQKPIVPLTRLAGDTTFFLSGPRAITEDEALSRAIDDLSRRVVEKVVEVW